ncbi:uncharacterized protein A4U43_C01F1610 [Asparagus officinalis]|uniref:Uncharacterized protein n=1 Tax=Asparagus officinalis TaxID=4686 RepID=A0A5P1FNG4_ASPOF|nr:uncharacterized protein A4U43_C01F1610 [Asparagus officinalis]
MVGDSKDEVGDERDEPTREKKEERPLRVRARHDAGLVDAQATGETTGKVAELVVGREGQRPREDDFVEERIAPATEDAVPLLKDLDLIFRSAETLIKSEPVQMFWQLAAQATSQKPDTDILRIAIKPHF